MGARAFRGDIFELYTPPVEPRPCQIDMPAPNFRIGIVPRCGYWLQFGFGRHLSSSKSETLARTRTHARTHAPLSACVESASRKSGLQYTISHVIESCSPRPHKAAAAAAAVIS